MCFYIVRGERKRHSQVGFLTYLPIGVSAPGANRKEFPFSPDSFVVDIVDREALLIIIAKHHSAHGETIDVPSRPSHQLEGGGIRGVINACLLIHIRRNKDKTNKVNAAPPLLLYIPGQTVRQGLGGPFDSHEGPVIVNLIQTGLCVGCRRAAALHQEGTGQ